MFNWPFYVITSIMFDKLNYVLDASINAFYEGFVSKTMDYLSKLIFIRIHQLINRSEGV